MFTRLSLQSAQHASGYIIYVADQEHAAYEDEYIKTTLAADFLCGVVPLYRGTLKITLKGKHPVSRVIQPQEMIDRIKRGFSFLGIATQEVDPIQAPPPRKSILSRHRHP